MPNLTTPIQPVALTGRWVRLEPLTFAHKAGLTEACGDAQIWQYLRVQLKNESDVETWIAAALDEQSKGNELPFAVVDLRSSRPVGSTRYFTVAQKDRGLEIGSTWLTSSVWRTPINSEAKFLLLQHAFESLGCIRVQFITDSRNERSRRAIERLGATLEGTMRHHMIMRDGYIRDSLLYSILDTEWPQVKQELAAKTFRI
jgi:RimJ/RimL family protein N-acetyltransferase